MKCDWDGAYEIPESVYKIPSSLIKDQDTRGSLGTQWAPPFDSTGPRESNLPVGHVPVPAYLTCIDVHPVYSLFPQDGLVAFNFDANEHLARQI